MQCRKTGMPLAEVSRSVYSTLLKADLTVRRPCSVAPLRFVATKQFIDVR
jgi:hypothetical protein